MKTLKKQLEENIKKNDRYKIIIGKRGCGMSSMDLELAYLIYSQFPTSLFYSPQQLKESMGT